jgi:hypothetical protein
MIICSRHSYYAQYCLWGLTVTMLFIISTLLLRRHVYRFRQCNRLRLRIAGGGQSKFVQYSAEKVVLHSPNSSGAPLPSEYRYLYTSHSSGRVSVPSSKDIDYDNVVQGHFSSLQELYRLRRTQLVSIRRLFDPLEKWSVCPILGAYCDLLPDFR